MAPLNYKNKVVMVVTVAAILGIFYTGSRLEINGIIFACQGLKQMAPDHPPYTAELNNSKTYIEIMAPYRGGSSYAASFFTVNPKVFYMFEPLTYLLKVGAATPYTRTLQPKMSSILWDLFSCNFDKVISLAKDLYKADPNFNSYVLTWHTRVFASVLKKHHLHIGKRNVSLQALEELCRESDVIVIKTVRAYYVEYMIPLMDKGVKVIHLLRDPRGIGASSKNTPRGWCENTLINVDFMSRVNYPGSLTKDILEKHYHVVKYEDIALHTPIFIAKMYDFVGLNMPQEVKDHVTSNKQVVVWQTSNNVKVNNGTSVDRWKKTLSGSQIRDIETYCEDVIKVLGYDLTSESRYNGTTYSNHQL